MPTVTRVMAILLALTVPALAQQAPPALSFLEQALGQKLLDEVNTNVQLRAQLLAAQTKIKSMEDAKADPPPLPRSKPTPPPSNP